MSRFRPIDCETAYLLPPSVQDWLPESHLARYVVDVVEGIDLSGLERVYAGRGSDVYHLAMLLSLLVYKIRGRIHFLAIYFPQPKTIDPYPVPRGACLPLSETEALLWTQGNARSIVGGNNYFKEAGNPRNIACKEIHWLK